MGRTRQQLHDLLLLLCPNVYFQPPENTMLNYPCIVYHRDDAKTEFANNNKYLNTTRYTMTIMDEEADSDLLDLVKALPMSRYSRWFAVDDLNHDVLILFF